MSEKSLSVVSRKERALRFARITRISPQLALTACLALIPPVKAEGLTEAQLETEIQRAYREANLMPNAQVSVTVQQGLARTFSILGSVQRPSLYAITQSDFRILDALVTAGDINSQ